MASPQRKLFLIPCCASKKPGGHSLHAAPDPLENLVPKAAYSSVLEARKEVLWNLRQNEKYLSGNCEKNRFLERGPDFGGLCSSGLYLPARERYRGMLYSNAPSLSSRNNPDARILILSALYGPLHPKNPIQNYNLKMSDSPAYKTWKKRFAPFLRCYVLSNGIREIYFFLGKSTHYLKVAEPAAKSLLEENLIDKAIQYCVVKGNSWETPTTHGRLLEKYLKGGQTDELPENIKACPIEKCP